MIKIKITNKITNKNDVRESRLLHVRPSHYT
jgi:hypothetical protein